MKKEVKVYLSGDHAGFAVKEKIKSFLEKKGFEVLDFGPKEYNKEDDYPDFVIPMAKEMTKEISKGVSKDLNSKKNKHRDVKGIIFAGSGEGEAIAVNRLNGIRAAVYHGKNLKVVKTTREHNDSNVLCIGVRFVKKREIKKAINLFLKTNFKGKRHQRRLNKIEKLTKK